MLCVLYLRSSLDALLQNPIPPHPPTHMAILLWWALPAPQAQEVSLNYHCTCEQYTHFAAGSFWNFQGTAGEVRVEGRGASGARPELLRIAVGRAWSA